MSLFPIRSTGTGTSIEDAWKNAHAKLPKPNGADVLTKSKIVSLEYHEGGIAGQMVFAIEIEPSPQPV